MNLLSVVNQIIDQSSEDDAQQQRLLGLPPALIGIDLTELSVDVEKHQQKLETALRRPIHPAAALLDLLSESTAHEIEDFCVLRKDALQDLMQAAIYDRLTGLYSRNIMDTRLREEYRRAKRYDLPLSALFVDVDDFKAINDNFGHSEGDRALSFIGRFILDRLREVDIPIRYGGEEFLVIIPHTAGQTALDLAMQLHDGIGAAQEKADLASSVTISIGVGSLTSEMSNESKIIDAADKAVYLAKKEKNRVWPGINGASIDDPVNAG